MREIKFRMWHKEQKKMYSADELGKDQMTIMPNGRGFVNVSGADTRLSEIDNGRKMIPLQYTGLLDKTGQEIYEGDIIQECIIGERIWEETKDGGGIVEKCPTGKVEYCGYYFNVQPITKGRVRLKKGYSEINISRYDGIFQWHLHSHDADYEVIGNIYANPELLK